MKIVDLTKPIQYYPNDPWFMKVKIKHKPHRKAKLLIRYLGLPAKLFPRGFIGWADDMINKLGVHSTTHLDAPWHYGPTCEGKPAKTIDQIPLEWCFGDGVVIDMKHKADFVAITKDDILSFLEKENTVWGSKFFKLKAKFTFAYFCMWWMTSKVVASWRCKRTFFCRISECD